MFSAERWRRTEFPPGLDRDRKEGHRLTGKTYSRRVELMEAELGDELVALDVSGGSCFGFNSVAASVWKLLATPSTADELRDQLMEEYDVDLEECETELAELLNDMTAKGLIQST
jgi:hypothetical protein